nr:nitroreductase family deazaflavin-dependent oxidoreductase [Mycolicibacterium malmesburyense]CRL75022.1 deazaflavin-dependent nitroreductase family protein [Mycolicibacterium malmesburyense]
MTEISNIREFNDALVDEFRANGGKVGGPFEGADLLLLHTTGAKSGQPRLSPLAYFRVDDKIYIVGSFAGADKDPAWVHNLRAHPRVRVEIGATAYDATARELPREERDALYPRLVEITPVFSEYQAKTSRILPVFELVGA